MAIVSGQETFGVGTSTAIGSATSTWHAIPVDQGSFSASESFENILDQGRRAAVEAMDFNSYQGVGQTEISFDQNLMYGAATGTVGSTAGVLLKNILGTGTTGAGVTSALQYEALAGSNVYVSHFRIGTTKQYLDFARATSQGDSEDQIARANYRGARLTELTFSFNAGEGFVGMSASAIAQTERAAGASQTITTTHSISDDVATGWSQSMSTGSGDTSIAPLAKWTNTLLGNASISVISADVTLSRAATPLYTMSNSKDYTDLFLGPLEATFSAVVELSESSYANSVLYDFRNNTTGGDTIFTASHGDRGGNDCRGIAIGMNNVTLLEAPIDLDSSGSYLTIALSGRALAGATTTMPISGSDYTKRSPVEVSLVERVNGASPPTYI